MIGYKLVYKCFDNKLYSAFTTDPRYKVRYLTNKFTEAYLGGLILFQELDQALKYSEEYLNESKYFQVWKCVAEEIVSLPEKAANWIGDYADVWNGIYKERETCEWPEGAIAAKRVKLLKRIK